MVLFQPSTWFISVLSQIQNLPISKAVSLSVSLKLSRIFPAMRASISSWRRAPTLFTKYQFDSQTLMPPISKNKRFCNLDCILLCYSHRDALFSRSQKGKGWRTGWMERHATVIRQYAGKLWWFNSHANYRNNCKKCYFQSSNTHSQKYLCTHPHCSKQKLHAYNYNLFYLSQLHVSWVITQRLDNPDRNPFHSCSPLKILILQYNFQSIHQ